MDDVTIGKIADLIVAKTELQVAVVGLFGVLVGSLISSLASYVIARMTAKSEMRREVYQKEVDRLYSLEDNVGRFVESVGAYRPLDDSKVVLLSSLDDAAGRFRRYGALKQAIRDVAQIGMILMNEKRTNPSAQKERADLEAAYQKFVIAYEAVLSSLKRGNKI